METRGAVLQLPRSGGGVPGFQQERSHPPKRQPRGLRPGAHPVPDGAGDEAPGWQCGRWGSGGGLHRAVTKRFPLILHRRPHGTVHLTWGVGLPMLVFP